MLGMLSLQLPNDLTFFFFFLHVRNGDIRFPHRTRAQDGVWYLVSAGYLMVFLIRPER